MGAQLSGPPSSARTGSRFRRRPMSEINVTPFVDVMLVLLIVFMITAPLLAVGVPVDLPQTRAATLGEPDEPLVISIDREGTVFIQEQTVTLEQLVPRLVAVTGANPETKIFVRGDRTIQYGTVMQVMGEVSAAGFRKVSLIAEMPGAGGRKK